MVKKKPTLKSMGIKRTIIQKHGVPLNVYKYKDNFYTGKDYAIRAYELDEMTTWAHKVAKRSRRIF